MTSIVVAAPIRPTAQSGNDITAARWAQHLTGLGHHVRIVAVDERSGPTGDDLGVLDSADVLVALHARRSAAVVRWWRSRPDRRPLVVGLTGTDLYVDMPDDSSAMASVEDADALIVLQRCAVDRLSGLRPAWGAKARVVHQSIDPATVPPRRLPAGEFRVVVLAHLREIKDPLLAARAVRLLDPSSRVRVHHGGGALDHGWATTAAAAAAGNPRWVWHGELARSAAMELLATAHVLACTSVAEGGANVVTEAIAVGVPVIGTRIDGNTGLLGNDHPGLVPVGDERALSVLLHRLETDPAELAQLQQRTDALAPIADPTTERRALADLLASLPAPRP
ncbi:MAG: selenoneine biosynthesis selenosugar synthase SenB [Acidimicrobiales bacterium]